MVCIDVRDAFSGAVGREGCGVGVDVDVDARGDRLLYNIARKVWS